jgi:hypothetical protein
MKSYPSIDGSSKAPHDQCIAFYKYDGSNLRFEWTKKRGWHLFGTRKRLFDETDPDFGGAIKMFRDTLAADVEAILKKEYRDSQEAVAFCEYFGDLSFAGQHKPEDTSKRLVLIDVDIHKKGFVSPREFVNNFCKKLGSRAAEVIYEGNLNASFIDDVRNGKYPVVEGVVCKGGSGHRMWRCKVKTNSYLQKLKEVYADSWESYWE